MQMAMLPTPYYRKQSGFTLIEVLVALAIVSIALTAVIKASSQSIRGTSHLQAKTQALWTAQYVVNEIRAGLIPMRGTSEEREDSVEMLGQTWFWHASKEPTANMHIDKIKVAVFQQELEKNNPVVSLESYVYRKT